MSISIEKREAVTVIYLDRPEKLNALSREMLDELGEVFTRLKADTDVRALILTGAGERAFCAGTDIRELMSLDEAGALEAARRGQRVCELIEESPVPVIAAVRGVAAGGGCELALACHLRVASHDAVLSLPETKLGLIPAYGGTQRLARLVGEGRALELMLASHQLFAPEALRFGLVNRITEGARLLDEALALAREIAMLAPLAIRACLAAVTRGLSLPLDEGLALEAELFSQLFATADVREGTRAFLEKRAPVFRGR
ncbi:MAG: enoyl-CoA hydratase/isomerase family protein [Acidobacteria bacterium]|nr:enoyl-CoA hydratase/isomerase family protein [Acidobacteriota bacterium]